MDISKLGVFGHTAYDIIMKVDTLPERNTSTAVETRVLKYGGTGANIATAASLLGVETRLASFVGEDISGDYKSSLTGAGVNIHDLTVIEGENTPTCWILSEEGGAQMAIIDQGAVKKCGDRAVQKDTIRGSDIVHIGTGDIDYYNKVLDTAKGMDKTIAFDPAQELRYVHTPDSFAHFLKNSDFFFCNEGEFEVAKDYLGIDEEDEMLEWVDVLVITLGKAGSKLVTRGACEGIPTYEPDRISDPTGAGDAYRAGFYAALSRNFSLVDSCHIASARASYALETDGPQDGNITWKMVKERVNKGKIIAID